VCVCVCVFPAALGRTRDAASGARPRKTRRKHPVPIAGNIALRVSPTEGVAIPHKISEWLCPLPISK